MSNLHDPVRNQSMREMQLQGQTLETIAKHFGITRQRVHQILNPRPPKEPGQLKRNAEILKLHREGVCVADLATRYKITQSSIYRIIDKSGSFHSKPVKDITT
jgi:Mor family transcriptional regulator